MGGTSTLPVLEPATRAVCDQVADRLDAEAVDLAATMTAAVVLFVSHRARLLDPEHVRYPAHLMTD
jgi:hypothetical protein